MKKTKEEEINIKQIDKCLPQIHCQKCGFFSCLPYAKAIVKKKVTFINVNQAVLKWLKNLEGLLGKRLIEPKLKICLLSWFISTQRHA